MKTPINYTILIVFLFALAPNLVTAQLDTISTPVEPENNYDTSYTKLPSLQSVIDSALLHSPIIKFYQSQVKINVYELQSAKYNWLDGVSFGAETKLGQTGGNQLEQLGLGYTSFAGVSFNLGDVLGQRNTKKQLSEQLAASEYKKEDVTSTVKREVITAYSDAKFKQKMVAIRSHALQSVAMYRNMAEIQFQEASIEIADLSKVYEAYTSALVLFEKAKLDYTTSLLILEEMVGTKLR